MHCDINNPDRYKKDNAHWNMNIAPLVLDLLARHTFSDLVARGKEEAVGERADQDSGYGGASQEHVEDDDLKSHGFQGVCAGDDHADHCAWQEDDPRGLRAVYQGDERALEGRLEDGG